MSHSLQLAEQSRLAVRGFADGREGSVYLAWERTYGRAEGENGRAKSGRLEKLPLILFE